MSICEREKMRVCFYLWNSVLKGHISAAVSDEKNFLYPGAQLMSLEESCFESHDKYIFRRGEKNWTREFSKCFCYGKVERIPVVATIFWQLSFPPHHQYFMPLTFILDYGFVFLMYFILIPLRSAHLLPKSINFHYSCDSIGPHSSL